MEHKLSKSQITTLSVLLDKKNEAKKRYEGIVEAEQELYAMIIKFADLPAKNYKLKQVGEDVILYSEDTPDKVSEDKKITKTKEKKES